MTLNSKIVLRPMALTDVPMLDLWDRQPHVIAATSDDPGQTKAFGDTYWPDELARVEPDNQYFMAELEGRAIGAIQIIDPHSERTRYWGRVEPNLRAIDIWIGSASDLRHGYGEQMMRKALQLCFGTPSVRAVVIDPLTSNDGARRFYRRLGFVPEVRRLFGEDDCFVHRLTRKGWRERFPADCDVASADSPPVSPQESNRLHVNSADRTSLWCASRKMAGSNPHQAPAAYKARVISRRNKKSCTK